MSSSTKQEINAFEQKIEALIDLSKNVSELHSNTYNVLITDAINLVKAVENKFSADETIFQENHLNALRYRDNGWTSALFTSFQEEREKVKSQIQSLEDCIKRFNASLNTGKSYVIDGKDATKIFETTLRSLKPVKKQSATPVLFPKQSQPVKKQIATSVLFPKQSQPVVNDDYADDKILAAVLEQSKREHSEDRVKLIKEIEWVIEKLRMGYQRIPTSGKNNFCLVWAFWNALLNTSTFKRRFTDCNDFANKIKMNMWSDVNEDKWLMFNQSLCKRLIRDEILSFLKGGGASEIIILWLINFLTDFCNMYVTLHMHQLNGKMRIFEPPNDYYSLEHIPVDLLFNGNHYTSMIRIDFSRNVTLRIIREELSDLVGGSDDATLLELLK
jgi:hypothetical protein